MWDETMERSAGPLRGKRVTEAAGPVEPDDHDEQVKQMWDAHVKLGRKAVDIALKVLDKIDPDDVPVQVAVQLLKFGVEVERRALLGVEPGEGGIDPFEALAQAAASVGDPGG